MAVSLSEPRDRGSGRTPSRTRRAGNEGSHVLLARAIGSLGHRQKRIGSAARSGAKTHGSPTRLDRYTFHGGVLATCALKRVSDAANRLSSGSASSRCFPSNAFANARHRTTGFGFPAPRQTTLRSRRPRPHSDRQHRRPHDRGIARTLRPLLVARALLNQNVPPTQRARPRSLRSAVCVDVDSQLRGREFAASGSAVSTPHSISRHDGPKSTGRQPIRLNPMMIVHIQNLLTSRFETSRPHA